MGADWMTWMGARPEDALVLRSMPGGTYDQPRVGSPIWRCEPEFAVASTRLHVERTEIRERNCV